MCGGGKVPLAFRRIFNTSPDDEQRPVAIGCKPRRRSEAQHLACCECEALALHDLPTLVRCRDRQDNYTSSL